MRKPPKRDFELIRLHLLPFRSQITYKTRLPDVLDENRPASRIFKRHSKTCVTRNLRPVKCDVSDTPALHSEFGESAYSFSGFKRLLDLPLLFCAFSIYVSLLLMCLCYFCNGHTNITYYYYYHYYDFVTRFSSRLKYVFWLERIMHLEVDDIPTVTCDIQPDHVKQW